MKYSGAEIIIKLLERQGITIIPGIPGGANLPLYDALYKSRKIRHILSRHEQGAGFIAQGMARSSGKAAVCFATSGPGATNLITAIADAKLDSIPLIAVTGQVPTSCLGTDAFQEVDTYGLTLPITKHNFLVRSARELLTVIPEAFAIAQSGRPGPVVIDVPKDVQMEKIDVPAWPPAGKKRPADPVDTAALREISAAINKAERPLLYIGGGIVHSGAQDLLRALAKKNSIPVTATLMGLGCFAPDDPLWLGMLGMHGARGTNMLLDEADVLLVFGARFDDRATGNIAKFCPRAKIIHIDIDAAEIDKLKQSFLCCNADIGTALRCLLPAVNSDKREKWLQRAQGLQKKFSIRESGQSKLIHPRQWIHAIGSLVAGDTIITTDVGQHQMWVAQYYPVHSPRALLTSGGLGTMGFGLPAAIGAALVNPGRRVVCFSGDGSLLMNIQELATLADTRMNVAVILMNNRRLGLVRQQQELFYNKHYIASEFITNPDFCGIARKFGIRSYDLAGKSRPLGILKKAFSEPGPCLVNVPIEHTENVMPMVPPGAANHEMIGGDVR